MMNDIALYMHAGSGNHGCEAIVDSLVRMMPVEHFRLMSNSAEEDEKYLPAEVRSRIEILEEQHIDRHFFTHAFYYAKRKLTGDAESFLRYRYKPLTGNGAPKLAVSIGGDNYCYPSMIGDLKLANSMFNRQGTATVLLGCSIEPSLLGIEEVTTGNTNLALDSETGRGLMSGHFSVSDRNGSASDKGNRTRKMEPGEAVESLLADLHRYRMIIARESITYEAVRKALGNVYGKEGENKVVYCPDPAFTLPSDDSDLPDWFEPGNTVGINLSPMAQDYAASGQGLLTAYGKLIQYILDTTSMKVALIPHVVWERSNDLVPLRKLHEAFYQTGRVQIVEDAPAEKLKGAIANCRFFIGARTHATIAAYSTLIPTLVIGYSVKARGIAKDLFGTAEHYVLPVQTLNDPEQLIDAWKWLFAHEDEFHYILSGNAPKFRAQAGQNADILQEVMQEI